MCVVFLFPRTASEMVCVGELYLATFLAVSTAVQGKGDSEWAVVIEHIHRCQPSWHVKDSPEFFTLSWSPGKLIVTLLFCPGNQTDKSA